MTTAISNGMVTATKRRGRERFIGVVPGRTLERGATQSFRRINDERASDKCVAGSPFGNRVFLAVVALDRRKLYGVRSRQPAPSLYRCAPRNLFRSLPTARIP